MSSSHVVHRSKTSTLIRFLFLINVLLAFHYYFPVYINSTFLSQFFENKIVNGLYTASAIFTLLVLINSAKIIKKFGLYHLMLLGITLEIGALFGLAFTSNILLVKFFFIAHQLLPPLLLFTLDICLESLMRTENTTGRIRSTYLTFNAAALVVSPFIVGKILGLTNNSYQVIYALSGLFCVALLFVVFKVVKKIAVHPPRDIDFFQDIKLFVWHPDLKKVFAMNFLLHCFYAIMVIYAPIYLHMYIGFSWETIGLLFTIMLLPFVLFEAPLGRMFDASGGVKDTLIAGYSIIAVILCFMFFYRAPVFIVWAIILFLSRVGASFVEVGTEYSFFRRVTDRNTGFISIFRMASPSAFIIAPFVAAISLSLLPIQYLFLAVSIAMLIGIGFAYRLKDR